jgi:hypothetical protein
MNRNKLKRNARRGKIMVEALASVTVYVEADKTAKNLCQNLCQKSCAKTCAKTTNHKLTQLLHYITTMHHHML